MIKWLWKHLRGRRTELLLAIGAVLLYIPAIGWGLPSAVSPELIHPWAPDDIAPLGPLAEVHNTFFGAGTDRFLAYPLMHYLVLAAAYGPYLLYLLAVGGLSHPAPVFPYGMTDPSTTLRFLSLIARTVTTLMAAGTVVAAYHLARSLWGRVSGLMAGIFVMLLYPMFYYSRTGNLDVPALFWGAAGLAVYAQILREGYTVRRGIWLGVLAAMSAGTKDQGVGLFVLMPLILLPLHLRRVAQSGALNLRRERWAAPAATLVAGILVYLVSSGFMFEPSRYLAHVAWITGNRPDSPVYPGYAATWVGYAAFLGRVGELATNLMSGPMLALAVAGILLAAARDRLTLALLLPAAGVFFLVIFPFRRVELRFMLPIGFVLACFAAYAAGAALRSGRVATRMLGAVLILGVCALPLARGIDITHAMLRDSRYAAGDWLKGRVQPGDQIGFFGPAEKLPPLGVDAELVRLIHYAGASRDVQYTEADIRAMASAIGEQAPDFIFVIPNHPSYPGFPYGSTCPNELYELLRDGSLGYRIAARFETPPLLAWARRPPLDYPVVNPPVQIFVRTARPTGDVGVD